MEGGALLNESTGPLPAGDYDLVARIAHIGDSHIIDEESPARLTFAKDLVPFAWRPYECYSTQLLDGIIRAINRFHEFDSPIDFAIHTGDAVDNRQFNELRWLLGVFDGDPVDPRSGPDDRASDQRGPKHLDAHAVFQPQGLYRRGVHGTKPSIPWYGLIGNHDRYALGVFPVVPTLFGGMYAPLPLPNRVGLFLPPFLDPVSSIAYAAVTPGQTGQPPQPTLAAQIQPNAERRYYTREELVDAHYDTVTGPPGHGFDAAHATRMWYSVSPVPGLRLVALDSALPVAAFPAGCYPEGAINAPQEAFLRSELRAAQERGELVVVLTHHPSAGIQWAYGSAVSTNELRTILNQYPCVVAHLAGHEHRNRVRTLGGYVEFETASTLDYPQEGRIVEVWKSADDIQLRYRVFSHLPDADAWEAQFAANPELVNDPLLEMRLLAFRLAAENPVVEGIVPPLELIRESLDNISEVVDEIGEGIGTLTGEITDVIGDIADTAAEATELTSKSDGLARLQAIKLGSPADRAGTIVLRRDAPART